MPPLEVTTDPALLLGLAREEFSYAAVEQALDPNATSTAAEDAPDSSLSPELLDGFRAALGVLVDLLIPPGGPMPSPQSIGIRLIALLQLIRPEALDGKSMNAISMEAGVTRAALSKMLVAYSDTLGFCARHQSSLKARVTYADVQRTLRVRARTLRAASARRAGADADATAA